MIGRRDQVFVLREVVRGPGCPAQDLRDNLRPILVRKYLELVEQLLGRLSHMFRVARGAIRIKRSAATVAERSLAAVMRAWSSCTPGLWRAATFGRVRHVPVALNLLVQVLRLVLAHREPMHLGPRKIEKQRTDAEALANADSIIVSLR
ncbi:MAG: hypothetical protein GEV06_06495 [Luteitalea sp.]|nr:hypothetical protein [Luteitalea sp.]